MFSETKVIGHLGQSPRFNTAKSGTSICSFSVAANEGYGEKKTTEWFNVITFGKTAETCNQYLQKGSLVLVRGTVHLHRFQKKDGTFDANLELVADRVVFLSTKSEQEQNQAPSQPMQMQAPSPNSEYFGEGFGGVTNEELPF